MSRSADRLLGFAVLLVLGMLSLPASAYVLDDPGTENWIVPVQLLAMAAVGAAVTVALPGMARAGAGTGRRALTGAWWGLAFAVTGVVVAWVAINGWRGA
ncbi:hypothetical protein GCM10011376_23040 [Nocardioides flavus (ex Wang et al. 2016)]|uniref:Uncharacterized protein n=1 Tax=Nocardioides flavus (ex Wang et al. 2016) TaxID=2058780 RepID=A0ABQ3HM08_9ACTN|nr:hypothetical protein [Nocardioides flavus (ex Wang et al. 2016)]GHE17694.1 hypothetical protein GCM10011376_23040 [Nocardioides flavus (ex Wang et al. 2016)]